MKMALLGSLGNINRILVPRLVAAQHEVTVITSTAARSATIIAMGAHAAVGTMMDAEFLAQTFAGQDVVYLMLAGSGSTELYAHGQAQADVFKQALVASGVRNVVNLSSIGADMDERAGALHVYNLIETTLNKLTDVNIAYVRPVAFYNNLFGSLASLRERRAIFSNVPGTLRGYHVAPVDIAATIEPLLTAVPVGKTVRYVASDGFSGAEFIAALNKLDSTLADLQYVTISDTQMKQGLLVSGVPEEVAAQFVQMGVFQRESMARYQQVLDDQIERGTVKLREFARQYGQALLQGQRADQESRTIID